MDARELFALDPNVTFLNHGSYGATPRPVVDYQSELRARMEANPVAFFRRDLPGLLAAARHAVGEYVGADPDGLAFLPNTTSAINTVARSLRLEPGDEILLDDHEYGALRLLWDEIARESGARVVAVELPVPYEDEREVVDLFAQAITGRTRLLFFSHITSLSSYVLPARELVELARDHDVLSVVDGAHAPGQIPLDLDTLGADVYAGNAHKWLCAPKGSAFLSASAAQRHWIRGDVVSWGWTWDGDGAYRQRFSWGGTKDPTAPLAIPKAIELRRTWDTSPAHAFTVEAADALERLGARRIARDELRAPQMVTLALPGAPDPEPLWETLWRDHRVEIPVETLSDLTITRVSAQVYTTADDISSLVAALEQTLP